MVLGTALTRSTDWAFQNEADPNTGEKWQPWSASYQKLLLKQFNAQTAKASKSKKSKKSKAKPEYKPHPMLQLHGMQGGGLRSTIQEVDGDAEASIGSNLRYARIHQLGGMTGKSYKVRIPARPYLGLRDDQSEKAKTKIGKLLAAVVGKLGK